MLRIGSCSLDRICRRHSHSYQHDDRVSLQVLGVDMSSLPCGAKATFATKGYFAKQRNRQDGQLGRVLATRYEEIVVDRLFDGKTQLTRALQPSILTAEATLQLDEDKRRRFLLAANPYYNRTMIALKIIPIQGERWKLLVFRLR